MRYELKVQESVVHEDEVSVTLLGLMSKFVSMGHVFYMATDNDRMFIPARSGGWRWFMDRRDFSLTGTALRLAQDEESRSCVAVRFDGQDPAPHPLQFTLSLPEFMGNFIAVAVSDEGEREKSFMQPIGEPMAIGAHVVNVVEADAEGVVIEVQR